MTPASTARATSVPPLSPAVLKMRPRCEAISPSKIMRQARAGVPISSRAINCV